MPTRAVQTDCRTVTLNDDLLYLVVEVRKRCADLVAVAAESRGTDRLVPQRAAEQKVLTEQLIDHIIGPLIPSMFVEAQDEIPDLLGCSHGVRSVTGGQTAP